LHLGCGEVYRDGWLNVDVSPAVDPDVLIDLDCRAEWSSLPSDHFKRVEACHVLEHLSKPVMAMGELARVLAPGGEGKIVVPVGVNSLTDPTHENYWTWQTPEYFDASGPYSWEAGTELELVGRLLSLEGHGPARHVTPVLDRLANVWPLWAGDLPGVSGELTATYRKTGDSDA
jgi:hypothetical protein